MNPGVQKEQMKETKETGLEQLQKQKRVQEKRARQKRARQQRAQEKRAQEEHAQKSLWRAAQRGHLDIMKSKLRSVLNFQNVEHVATQVLRIAAHNDHADCVAECVDHCVAAFASPIRDKVTFRRDLRRHYLCVALHAAASSGALNAMKRLIEAGALLKYTSVPSGLPCLWAAQSNQKRAFQLLLDAKADVRRRFSITDNSHDQYGMSPVMKDAFSCHFYEPVSVTHLTAVLGCRWGVLRLARVKVDLNYEITTLQQHERRQWLWTYLQPKIYKSNKAALALILGCAHCFRSQPRL
jgi:hypothetical protein